VPYFWDTEPDTLPQPELNPLTNPVLERNLGRWAQAYFSNPPGQRELAISRLLEEIKSETSEILTAERARREFSARSSEPRSPDARSSESRPSRVEPPDARTGEVKHFEERTVTCSICQQQNAERERFCGQCGAALNSVQPDTEDRSRNRIENRNRTSQLSEAPQVRAEIPPAQPDTEVPDSEVQWLRERAFSSAYEYEAPASHGWKYALGLVVIAAAGFAYLHWGPNLPNQNKSAPQAQGNPARVTAPTLPRPAEEQPSQAIPSAPKDSAPGPPAVTASTSNGSEGPPSLATVAPQPGHDRIMPSEVQPAAAKSSALGATSMAHPIESLDGGVADLRLAQRYLGGGLGARDSSEAAKLLWKSVRQQNATAAILLSELYARGDGVSRNCDQARLLLVAAAKRGSPQAADQLRTLELRGCR
jgi:hypothetical protein